MLQTERENRSIPLPMIWYQMASLYIYKEKAFESIFYGDSSLWVSVESMTILSKGGRGPLLCGEGVREGGGSGLGWHAVGPGDWQALGLSMQLPSETIIDVIKILCVV